MKLKRALFALCALIYFLLVLGGLVRNLGAGLSCPDWPLCFGRIIPPFEIHVYAEYFHRLAAALVSFLTLGIAIYVFTQPEVRKVHSRLATIALLLLLSQVILGGLTVLKLLQSEIVTLHLATGTMFFAIVLLMAIRQRRYLGDNEFFAEEKNKKRPPPSPLWGYAFVALMMLYLQMIFGGSVSSHFAALACPDFPKCNGQWWPGFEGLVGFQLLHRLGALFAFILIMNYVIGVERSSLPRPAKFRARFVGTLLIVQILLGIGNVILRLPIAVSVLHLAVAEAMFALILISTYEIRHIQLH